MSLPNLFLTGANGYIAGTFLTILQKAHPGMAIRALVRTVEQATNLRNFCGPTVQPVVGSIDDAALLRSEAARADIVVHGAGEHIDAVTALMEGIALHKSHASPKETERPVFIHISGSSNVGHAGPLGELARRVYSDVHDLSDILTLEDSRTNVRVEKRIRALGQEKGVRALIISPPTILGRGLGAGRKETFQVQWFDAIVQNGAAFLVGEGANAWSVVSVQDLGRALVFVVDEVLKGEASSLEYGNDGYYFVEALEVSLMERARAVGERLFADGRIGTGEVQLKALGEVVERWGAFMGYLVGSSSRIKADRLRALGWTPLDMDWKVLVEEAGGIRC